MFLLRRQRHTYGRHGSAYALAFEKGADSAGCYAIAQVDVAQFYEISPLKVGAWIHKLGCPAWMAAAVVMLQLCCMVLLQVGECEVELRQICSGCLTGSRVAGCLW